VLFSDAVVIKPNDSTPIKIGFEDFAARVAGRKDKGLLTITSDPAGMTVVVDDGTPAETPITLELEPGTHKFQPIETLIVGSDRYYAGQPIQWVIVPAGDEAVIPIKLETLASTLDYSLIPSDCAITLDGAALPRGPDKKTVDVAAGYHSLQVTRGGSSIVMSSIRTRPNAITAVSWGYLPETAYEVEERQISFKANSRSWDDIQPVLETGYPRFLGNYDNYSIKSVKFARNKKYFYWHIEFADTNPLYSLPPDSGGKMTVQLDIERAKNGIANLNLGLESEMNRSSGF